MHLRYQWSPSSVHPVLKGTSHDYTFTERNRGNPVGPINSQSLEQEGASGCRPVHTYIEVRRRQRPYPPCIKARCPHWLACDDSKEAQGPMLEASSRQLELYSFQTLGTTRSDSLCLLGSAGIQNITHLDIPAVGNWLGRCSLRSFTRCWGDLECNSADESPV